MSSVRIQPKLIIINYENFSFTKENFTVLKKLKDLGHYLVIATDKANNERQNIAKLFAQNNITFDFIYNWDDFAIDSPRKASANIMAYFYAHIRANIKRTSNLQIDISKEDTISLDDSFNNPDSPMLKAAMKLGYQRKNLLVCNQLGSLLPIELQQHPQSAPPKNKPSASPSYRGWKIGGAIIGCIIGAIVAGIVGPDMGLKAGIQTFIWWASLGAMGTVGGWFVGEELGENAALIQKAEPVDNRQAAVPGMGWASIALQLSPAAEPRIQASAKQNQSNEEQQHELPSTASRPVQIPEASPWTRQRKMSSYNRSLLADKLAQHGHSPQPFHHSNEDPLARRERIAGPLRKGNNSS